MTEFKLDSVLQGTLGHHSEKSPEELTKDYADFLFDGEKIMMGHQMVRDDLILTTLRIILVSSHGLTGNKASFKSIYLHSIVNIDIETAGMGSYDSELTITYMENVNQKSDNQRLRVQALEFPKNTSILPLYRTLGNISVKNRERINN